MTRSQPKKGNTPPTSLRLEPATLAQLADLIEWHGEYGGPPDRTAMIRWLVAQEHARQRKSRARAEK